MSDLHIYIRLTHTLWLLVFDLASYPDADLKNTSQCDCWITNSIIVNTGSHTTGALGKPLRLLHPYLGIWNSSDHETQPMVESVTVSLCCQCHSEHVAAAGAPDEVPKRLWAGYLDCSVLDRAWHPCYMASQQNPASNSMPLFHFKVGAVSLPNIFPVQQRVT